MLLTRVLSYKIEEMSKPKGAFCAFFSGKILNYSVIFRRVIPPAAELLAIY